MGLIPYWCEDPKGGRKPINAKCETVAILPTFREAYWRRRCIVPVDGFFEWKAVKGQKGYNMKLVSLICALSLLCPFAVHAQEANVKKVLNIYDTGSIADKQSIVTILTAVEDGMGWANAELKKRKDTPPLYCVPDGFGLTGEQILEMLRKEAKENPSSAEKSYGLVMLETLEKVFPCNK